jgi:hypothetical protein
MTVLSLLPVSKKNWILKASVFDEQIIVFFYNRLTVASFMKIFYNEECAYEFIEDITKT